ncbi:glycosyltransferase family 4 protein [Jidongwangia harbinensis]|uniref:glycosyltransferase family 4 protein n=1 Tax=Jidongwangia harbinensis TaxID=2878561 RepID=UPI001CD9CAB1|nr:glycosyltransferase family 4 protein [Jidongwangia harbinensis]MCA2212225.1 glycosyltransferase [Jidongwangia harbinensis]
MKVLFLINNGFGIGGTITTTFNLASALAARGHEVEVLSTLRHRDIPQLPVHPNVKLMALVDTRPAHPDYDAEDPLRGQPAEFYPKADYRSADYDKMIEDRYERFLKTSDADVVIATRAGLIAYVARFAPDRMIRIGQEHLTRRQQRKAMREELPIHINRLDGFVTITKRDAKDYRKHLNLKHTKLLFIPNSVPVPTVPPSDGRAKIVVAAGRLVEGKRYDVLIRGFAKVVPEHPDWQLRIYGLGKLNDELRRLVLELGLHNHVLMMGPYTPIETEWAKGSVAAVPSDREPFGMTLVEAMRCGVPVVSTNAPYGPAEILADDVDGILTPVGDPDAMGDALLRVVSDDEKRRAMAEAALKNSERYDPDPIAERYEQLFAELAERKARRRARWWSRFLPRRTPGPVTPPVLLGPAPTLTVPTATCVAAPGGELEVRPGPAVPEGTALVWRRIGGPAEIPVGERVSQGIWQLFTADGVEVQAGALDTRALIDHRPEPGQEVLVRLPYRLPDGGLGLRVWRRPVHAEVGDVRVDADGVHVDAEAFGVSLDGAALKLLGPEGKVVERPLEPTSGTAFRTTVPALDPGVWGLWLRPADGDPIRFGRFLDDVARKNVAYVLPAATLGEVKVQPYYEQNNEFSVRVTA